VPHYKMLWRETIGVPRRKLLISFAGLLRSPHHTASVDVGSTSPTSWNQHWAIQLRLPLGKFCNHILRRKDHVFNTVLFFNILFFVNVNSQLRRYWNLTLTAPKRR
ncbi:MAG: hypothetical protein ACBR12_19925, partial [Microcoleus sp.]